MRKKTIKVLLALLSTLCIATTATACLAGGNSGKSSSSSSSRSSYTRSSSTRSSSSRPIDTGVAPPPTSSSAVEIDSFELNETTLTLDPYEYYQLEATINEEPASASGLNVTWSSNNPGVATVVDGKVTAVSEGSATIVAQVEGETAVCIVEVVDTGAAATLELDYEVIGVGRNTDFDVTATVYFKGQPVTQAVDLTWAIVSGEATDVVSIAPSADTLKATLTGENLGATKVQVSGVVFGTLIVKEIEITVVDASVAIEVTSTSEYIVPTTGGYAVSLNLGSEGVKYVTPGVVFKSSNEVVSSVTFSWSSLDTSVATVASDGRITAAGVGETTVTGTCTYNGETYTVDFFVTVEKTYSGDMQDLYFETASGFSTFECPASWAQYGELTQILINGTDVLSSYNSATMTASLNASTLKSIGYGKYQAYAKFGTSTTLDFEVGVYTKVLRTAADIDNWGTYAKAENSNKNIWSGHFILGNNISYNKVYEPFMTYPILGDGVFGVALQYGFNGTFDGQGYNIEGVTIPMLDDKYVGAGFVGQLMIGGVFKNVSFTKARVEGAAGLITSCSAGTIENVYAQVEYLGVGWVNDPVGVFMSKDNNYSARVINCFAQIDSSHASEYTYTIGKAHENLAILQNVYTVGGNYNNAWGTISVDVNDNPIANVAAGYENYAALKASGVNFAGWINDFWAVKNGIPYPKNLSYPGTESTLPATQSVEQGETVNVSSAVGGIAFDMAISDPNNVVASTSGATITVSSSAAAGSTFTVTLTSVFDSNVTMSVTYTVVQASNVTLAEKQYVELGSGRTTKFDLSSIANDIYDMQLVSATYNGNAVTVDNYSDLSAVQLSGGGLTSVVAGSTAPAVLTFQKTSGSEIVATIKVTVNAMAVTMAIRTADDLDSFLDVAYAEGGLRTESSTGYTYGVYNGYFVLANDIDYSASVSASGTNYANYRKYDPTMSYADWTGSFSEATWANGRDYGGFAGTFDGQGYNIDRFMIGGVGQASGAFIGKLNVDGIIKNVSFTNGYHDGWGGFVCATGDGTVQDVYVQLRYQAGGGEIDRSGVIFSRDLMAEATVRRVIVKVDEWYTDGGAYVNPLGTVHLNYGIYQGVYAIGGNTTTPCHVESTGTGEADVYGAYADQAAFTAANIDFSSWTETGFWTLDANGDPVAPVNA